MTALLLGIGGTKGSGRMNGRASRISGGSLNVLGTYGGLQSEPSLAQDSTADAATDGAERGAM